jgi:serine/threonine-protein kinase
MGKLRDLTPGFVLGRYELVLRIATGGMGEIWAARLRGSRGFQKLVAIKTLLPELSHSPSFEQMFLDEAALASRIKHPNVVHVIDLGEKDQVLYQVMEWVSGESLWSLMRAAAKRDGIPLLVAARILSQVCAGLHAAHELRGDDGKPIGLVHRDMSPQNVLVTADGIAKVVDFGVAKYAGRGVAETQAGELRGKVPYMAPEHILGRKIDRRADVFALGVLFYQLVSGVHPFLADDDRLTLARISSPVPAVPLRVRVPQISERLSQVVAAALAKSPEARTASAADLMRGIESAVPEAGVQSTNAVVADYMNQLVGENVEHRAHELREALRRLDEAALPVISPPPRKSPTRSAPPLPPRQRDGARAKPAPAARAASSQERHSRTPPLGTSIGEGSPLSSRPSRPPAPDALPTPAGGITGVSNTLDLEAEEPIQIPGLAPLGGKRAYGAFVSPAVGAALAIVAVLIGIGITTRRAHDDGTVPAASESIPSGPPSAADPAPLPTMTQFPASPSTSSAAPDVPADAQPSARTEAEPSAVAPKLAPPQPAVGSVGRPPPPRGQPTAAPLAPPRGRKQTKEFTPGSL